MQVADSRAEDSSESGSSQEKALGSSSSSFTSSEGGAVKPVDGKRSDEDASVTHIPAKRHGIKKPAKKTVVGTANSISSGEADLVNGTTSLKEASEDGQDKPDLELNTVKENTEDSEEDASGEERLMEASKGSQKVEEVTKIAKPKGRPPKHKVTLQSEETGEVKLPEVAKPREKPPKTKDYHSSDNSESKVEEQDEMLEARSGSEEGDTGEAEGLSHDTENSESMEVLPPLASTKRGQPPKAKSAGTEKVARPRGRPPKPADSQSGSEGEPAKSPGPRGRPPKRKSDASTASSKRGRPPKARLMESNTEEGGAVVHARPRGRPPKGAQDGATLMSPKRGTPPKPKAKRGRPSKASLMQSDIASPGRGRQPKPKKKRGRPSLASLAVASNASPARPRGRPPKQSPPRGKQRKLPLPSSPTEGEQPATPRRGQPPKAKGRQSKVKTDSGAKKNTKFPRPRGRPRNIKVAKSGTEESSEIDDPEVTASSDRESSPTEREDQSGSESGMKEAGKGISQQEAGQTHTAKMKGRPPKRKSMSTTGRGRPPKVRVTDTGTEGETEETEPANSVPSKRGRPPKVKPAQSGIEEDGVEPAVSVSPGRGRPPKAKLTKKGRPPKAKAVEVNAEGEACGEDKDQMTASPGAGSLQTDEEDAVASAPSDGEESGEKEGVTIEVTGAKISDKEDEEEVKAKAAGKGRPPKVKDFKSSGEQKKRGRPAKAKDSEQA